MIDGEVLLALKRRKLTAVVCVAAANLGPADAFAIVFYRIVTVESVGKYFWLADFVCFG